MVDFALDPAERALLASLTDLGVPFMIVGVTAASMQGARVATEHIDLWFSKLDDPRLAEAARRIGPKTRLLCQPLRRRSRCSRTKNSESVATLSSGYSLTSDGTAAGYC